MAKRERAATVSCLTGTQRDDKINELVSAANKKHGINTVTSLGQNQTKTKWPTISTEIISLDTTLGGGIPRGRVALMWGLQGCYKTSLALTLVGNEQRAGGKVLYLDAENALNPAHMEMMGVDLEGLLVHQVDTAEEGLTLCQDFVESGAITLAVIDSLAALKSRVEEDNDLFAASMGSQSRMLGKFFRRIIAPLNKTGCALLCINQVRSNLSGYGSAYIQPGGHAPQFTAAQSIELKRTGTIKEGDEVLGHNITATTVKNKINRPFLSATFDVLLDSGFDKLGSLIDAAVDRGVIKASGSWFTLPNGDRVQGKENVKQALTDPALYAKVYELVSNYIEKDIAA